MVRKPTMTSESEPTMENDSVGGASDATAEKNEGVGDTSGGAAGDNVGAGMRGESTDMVHAGNVMSADSSDFTVKRDSDGKIIRVEDNVVAEAIARDGSFAAGKPVTFTMSPDASIVLSLGKSADGEKSASGKEGN